MGGLGALGVSTTAYGFSAPVVRLRVARYDLSPPQWPAGLKLRIAAIADLHACDPWMSLDHVQAIVERTNALKPDIVVMLGDYVAGHRKVTRFIPDAEWARGARRIEGAARRARGARQSRLVGRQGQCSAKGRGCRPPAARWRPPAFRFTKTTRRSSIKNGHSFWLAGLGDQLAYMPARRFRPLKRIGVDDLGATLAKITDDAPVVLMAHEPDIARRVPSRVALQLSGHTHGGQVRMLGWSPISPSGQQLAYGHISMNCDVVVSGGLGCSIMPFRLGVPPEIVLVTLGAARPAVA